MTNSCAAAPILSLMHDIEGWLADDEAALLVDGVGCAVHATSPPHAVVEVGSYCGRSTVVLAAALMAMSRGGRVYAVDPHDGVVGAEGEEVTRTPPTLERFEANVARAGVADVIEVVPWRSYQVNWTRPIAFLFIDGLHDYANVARDFQHFAPWIGHRGVLAFHDYGASYPGVTRLVDEILLARGFAPLARAGSLILLQRC
jgi:hypothetical protein